MDTHDDSGRPAGQSVDDGRKPSVDQAQLEIEQLRETNADVTRDLERLKSHPAVAGVLRVSEAVLPPARRFKWRAQQVADVARSTAAVAARAVAQRGAAERKQHFEQVIDSLGAVPERGVAMNDSVGIVTLTHNGRAQLFSLLQGLRRATTHDAVEMVIVDNASDEATSRWLAELEHGGVERDNAPPIPVRVLRNEKNLPFAEANNAAIETLDTDWVLLLNDDVVPHSPEFIRRLLATVESGVDAVGAQLVHRQHPAGDPRVGDWTVQHRGIDWKFSRRGPGVPVNAGAERVALLPSECVAAATAACLLVRRLAFDEVGGFDDRFIWGAEDIDLCLRLDGDVAMCFDAIATHAEGLTRRSAFETQARLEQQQRNWRLFSAEHGPDVHRALWHERLDHDGKHHAAMRPWRQPAPSVTIAAEPGSAPEASGLVADLDVRRWPTTVRQLTHFLVPSRTLAHDDILVIVAPREKVLADRGHDENDPVRVAWVTASWEPALHDTPDLLDEVDLVVASDERAAAAVTATQRRRDVLTVTDRKRADTMIGGLRQWIDRPSVALATATPPGRTGRRWGDLHLAEALARELRADGRRVEVLRRDEWDSPRARSCDVVVSLRGKTSVAVGGGQRHVIWSISHPDALSPSEVAAADHVFVGSELMRAQVAGWGASTPVDVMMQATDHRRFTPGPIDADIAHEVVFVGNSRGQRRESVAAALDAGLDVAVYGSNWEKFLPPKYIAGRHVDNAALPAIYRSAGVVLCDHWDDMQRAGYLSNRVFDVLGAGGVLVSDDVAGLSDVVGDLVPTFADPDELGGLVAELLSTDQAARRQRGRTLIEAAHTMRHRAQQLATAVDALAARR